MKRESRLLHRPAILPVLCAGCLLHAACFPLRESAQPVPRLAVAPTTQPMM